MSIISFRYRASQENYIIRMLVLRSHVLQ